MPHSLCVWMTQHLLSQRPGMEFWCQRERMELQSTVGHEECSNARSKHFLQIPCHYPSSLEALENAPLCKQVHVLHPFHPFSE